jgi:hypothetical protein
VALAIVTASGASADGQPPLPFRGLPLTSALARLQQAGLRIMFSSDLVRPGMVVADEPRARELRAVLDELLAPHGLQAVAGSARTLLIVKRPAKAMQKPFAGASSRKDGASAAMAPPAYEEAIVVRPTGPESARARPEAMAFIERRRLLVAVGADRDPMGAAARLSGIGVAQGAGRVHVRGGAQRDTRVVLDGLELYDPYHLKDRGSPVSSIDADTLAGMTLLSGTLPAEYGGALGGVVAMDTIEPPEGTHGSIGLSTNELRLSAMGSLGRRVKWLASGRRGHPARLLDALDADPGYRPAYSDAFGKLEYRPGAHTRLALHVHGADEEVEGLSHDDVFETTREVGEFRAWHGSRYGWVSLTRSLGPRVVASATVSLGRIVLDRLGANPRAMDVRDSRAVSVMGLRHDWAWQSPRHLVRWGVDLRGVHATYRFASTSRSNDGSALARAGTHLARSEITREPEGRDVAVHLSDMFRVTPRILIDVGVRAERQTYGRQRSIELGPRLNAVANITGKTVVRVGWARVSQSPRIDELQIEDGVRDFHPPERAEQRSVTVAREIAGGGEARVSLYQTRVTDVNPRFENLFEPAGFLPAASDDRVEVAAERARAEGLEVAAGNRVGARLEWRAAYALARTEDRIGGVWVPRSWDQRHAIDAAIVWHPTHRWDVTLAARGHSGWPATPLSRVADPDTGVWTAAAGARNSRRLPSSRGVDLRVARRVTLGGLARQSAAQVSVTVANVFNGRSATSGRTARTGPTSEATASRRYALQDLPRLITLGVSWSF